MAGIQNRINTLLTDGRIGCFVIAGVKGDQRPDRAVHTLLFNPVDAVCAVCFNQIPIANCSCIFTDGRECNDQTGVFGRLILVQRTVHVDLCRNLIDGCHNAVVVIGEVHVILSEIATACQAEHRPFTCARAEGRCGNSSCKLCHCSVQHGADILGLTRLFRLRLGFWRCSTGGIACNRHSCICRRGNNAGFTG